MKKFNLIFILLFAGMFVLVMSSLKNDTSNFKESSDFSNLMLSQGRNSKIVNNHFSLNDVPKPLVNYDFFETLVKEVKQHREKRLVSLDAFLKKAKEPKTLILDTRSKEMYDLKHLKGAIHLNFSDFTQPNLDALFAQYNGKKTQVLIYCNNNFFDPLELMFQDMAFVSKSVQPVFEKSEEVEIRENATKQTLALNIPTFINLYGYGYQNIYELHEFVSVHDPRVAFEGTFDDEIK